MAKKMLNKTQRGMLKAGAFLCSAVITVLGFGGCCRDEAVVEYGVMPLYGVITPDYGVMQAPYEELDEEAEEQDSVAAEPQTQQARS
jgi:hypothetical protein